MTSNNRAFEEIKNVASIVDVVGEVVQLKRAGSNYKGCCPFHNEKTPSFVVSEQKQIFTCFGCGASGDVIEFTKRYYNLDFKEAIEKLGAKYNINVEFKSSGNNEEINRLYEINREAAAYFMRALYVPGNRGYQYIAKRGLKPETLKAFGIGYADEEWHSLRDHMRSKGYSDSELVKLGLLSESKGKVYDKFRNRVIFPIINTGGKVIGFGGRIIGDGEPKYLNSPESPVFQKKNNIYALNLTRKDIGEADTAILVEGYMDVVSLYQSGIKNVGASLGTALTENQAKLLKRYTKNVVLSYDADSAGRKAALRGIEILHNAECKVKVLHVSDGKDPDEFVKKNGPEAYRNEVKSALNYAEYKLEDVRMRYEPKDDDSRLSYMKAAADVIRSLSPVEQDIYIKKVSEQQHISSGALKREVENINSKEAFKPERTEKNTGSGKNELKITAIEKQLIKLIIIEPEYYKEIVKRKHAFVSPCGINIINGIINQMGSAKESLDLDLKALADSLQPHEAEILREINENVPVTGDREIMLRQCFNAIEKQDLEKRRTELTQRLDLIDDTDSSMSEAFKDIMDELRYLDKAINDLKSK